MQDKNDRQNLKKESYGLICKIRSLHTERKKEETSSNADALQAVRHKLKEAISLRIRLENSPNSKTKLAKSLADIKKLHSDLELEISIFSANRALIKQIDQRIKTLKEARKLIEYQLWTAPGAY